MLLGVDENQVKEWKNSLHSYEKQKRTKRPFGKQLPTIQYKTHHDEIQKQQKFHPILQICRKKQEDILLKQIEKQQKQKQQHRFLNRNYKYYPQYDIVNLVPNSEQFVRKSESPLNSTRKKQLKNPIYNQFNLINGKQYDQNYLQKLQAKNDKKYHRHFLNKDVKNYNIISCSYKQEEKDKYKDTVSSQKNKSSFNRILQKYQNPEEQQKYYKMVKQKQLLHASNAYKNLPESYLKRQSFQLNQSLPVPQVVKNINQLKKQSKQRYLIRHIADQQYRQKSEYINQKKQIQALNRIYKTKNNVSHQSQMDIFNRRSNSNINEIYYFGKQITHPVRKYSGVKSSAFSTIQ